MSDKIRSSEITPPSVYFNRRTFIRGGIVAAGAVGSGVLYRKLNKVEIVESKARQLAGLRPGENPAFRQPIDPVSGRPEELTPELKVINYNNFYEFTTNKDGVAKAAAGFETRNWKLEVGGRCHKPRVFGLEDILAIAPPEERIFRFRCVEAWSMVIPWAGISLAKMLTLVEPMGDAKYVHFNTLNDPQRMPGLANPILEWPYSEGYTLAEAMHPLTTLTTGLYGKELPPQNGAPIRIIVPWKYGFKNIKSIVKMTLLEKQPPTSWNQFAPSEYGFYGNVNPAHDHPRWSQATEQRIGESGRRKTLMFNGYADQVAGLYAGLDLHVHF
ncbi:MAG: protein-methionine-sulfoxide reductase catalytic subunit MsrP [Kofleriaceae bacterium]|nr:protein-methionine-sulfoxide reductase catalytic subunit MsrP [Kofleriaceae bacterium]